MTASHDQNNTQPNFDESASFPTGTWPTHDREAVRVTDEELTATHTISLWGDGLLSITFNECGMAEEHFTPQIAYTLNEYVGHVVLNDGAIKALRELLARIPE